MRQTNAQNVKIIEFGWDYPDVVQMSVRLDSMQNTSFDGICFSLQRQIMEAFDTSLQKDSYFEFKNLQALKWGKYSSNFIILRGFSITGGNWFDDKAWKNISVNMNNVSKAMQIGNLKGILFDPEYYYENKLFNPWTFSTAQYPGKTLLEVQNKVKQRGKQFITALQSVRKSFNFISIWIASLIAQERKYTPLDKTRHVLLISFIEGILEDKNKNVTITDGNEYAYWNTKPSEFLEAKTFLKNTLLGLLHSEKSKKEAKNIEIAQPVFYDGLIGASPSFEKGLKRDTKWKWLNQNIKFAIAASDKYVWFYNERLNWWNGNLNDTVLTILQENKSAFIKSDIMINDSLASSYINNISDNNIDSEQGYYVDINKNKNKIAFDFDWNLKVQQLNINFRNNLPATTSIYINNSLAKQIAPTDLIISVGLPTFDKGTLVIINEYEDKTESSAIYILK
ncbi:MAG: hypothetical protein ABI091_10545 [Ferruginibacter sp.]